MGEGRDCGRSFLRYNNCVSLQFRAFQRTARKEGSASDLNGSTSPMMMEEGEEGGGVIRVKTVPQCQNPKTTQSSEPSPPSAPTTAPQQIPPNSSPCKQQNNPDLAPYPAQVPPPHQSAARPLALIVIVMELSRKISIHQIDCEHSQH